MVYVNITGKNLRPPNLIMDATRRQVAVVSFRCELEEKPLKTEIYCIKSNLVGRHALNPDQILCFITAKKGERFLSFTPYNLTPMNMATRRLVDGKFDLVNLRDEDVAIVDAALQLQIREANRPPAR